MISQNGTSPASPPGQTGTTQKNATTFLPDAPFAAWRTWLYALTRARWLGISLLRWLFLLLIGLAVVWPLSGFPGSWAVSLVWLIMAAVLGLTVRVQQRRYFTAFQAQKIAPRLPHALSPVDKRPVYVTGALSVQEKMRTFTALPGFYRSFATREHALLCRVQERRVLRIATWPEEEVGLWYAFFTSQQIISIQPGTQTIGRRLLPALTVTYWPTPPLAAKPRQPPAATLYLAFPNSDDHAAVLADLMVEWQPAAASEGHNG